MQDGGRPRLRRRPSAWPAARYNRQRRRRSRKEESMTIELLPARPEHVSELGRICYEAFKDIHDRHGFPSDFTSVRFARMVIGSLVKREDYYGVAALADGQPAGSTFLLGADEGGGVGPGTVEVSEQGNVIGRALMRDVLEHARQS